MNLADAALIQIPGTGTGSPREAAGEYLQLVRGATTISRSPGHPDREEQQCRNPVRVSAMGVRREKAALCSGRKAHPAIRSSRKQPEQVWRRRMSEGLRLGLRR